MGNGTVNFSFKEINDKKEKEKLNQPKIEREKNFALMLYRDARNKHAQIKILSQLYDMTNPDVALFLKNNGYDDSCIRSFINPKKK